MGRRRAAAVKAQERAVTASPALPFPSAVSGPPVTRQMIAAASDLVKRAEFSGRAGLSFGGVRDVYSALGYTRTLSAQHYHDRYQRGDISERIIEAYPRATWGGGFEVIEDPNADVLTGFEQAVAAMFERLDVGSRLMRADILAGLGRYSVLLLGAPGNLDTELQQNLGEKGLIYLQPYSELRATVVETVSDPADERFGLPSFYSVKVAAGKTVRVHWSRCIHVSEGLLEDEIYGKPRLRAVWNRLDDLDKIVGGGAEAAWKRMDPGMAFDFDPLATAAWTPEQREAAATQFKDQLTEYDHDLRRHLLMSGVTATPLSASVSAFESNVNSVLQIISATTGIPVRILTGSERGELASSQDRSNWNDRNSERRREFAEPMVRELVARLVEHGALPAPKQIDLLWPDFEEMSEPEKASVSLTLAQANAAQVAAGGTVILTENEIRQRVHNLDALDDVGPEGEEGDTVSGDEDAGDAAAEAEEATIAAAAGGRAVPDHVAVRRAADRHRRQIAGLVRSTWLAAGASIPARELTEALASRSSLRAERIVKGAMLDVEQTLREDMPAQLLATMAAGGNATLRSAKARKSWFGRRARSASSVVTAAAPKFPISFNVANPRAIAFAEERSSELVTEISEDTRAAIRDMIADGIRDGIAPRALSRRIRDSIGLRSDQVAALNRYIGEGATPAQAQRYADRLLRQRATLIARTESGRSANQGQVELWRQGQEDGSLPTDGSLRRIWLATNDDRTRPEHAELDGATTGIDEPFPGGIEPGSEPQCRCGQGLTEVAP